MDPPDVPNRGGVPVAGVEAGDWGRGAVGVQVGREPRELVAGDVARARWELDLGVVTGPDGSLDFRGTAVHGKRGDRFLYRIDPGLVSRADQDDRRLVGAVRLTDARGAPRCARVDPPDLEWTIE